jgi:hypothetical protein
MRGKELTSGPAWNCFRSEFRRRWRGRNVARALGLLLLIAGLQFALTLGAQRLWATPAGFWLSSLIRAFGLYSSLAQMFAGSFGSMTPSVRSYLLVQNIAAIPWLACHFLMPAAAASSIAPDREQRRISELILAGLSPRQILTAKGLAAVLPFLAISIASLIGVCAAYPLMRGSFGGMGEGGTLGSLYLAWGATSAAGTFLSTATQVCLSALSTRIVRALVICYGYECLLVPLFSLAATFGWRRFPFPSLAAGLGSWEWLYSFLAPYLVVLLFQAVLFLLLWPRALRALAYPDEVAGSRPTPVRDSI